MVLALAAMLAVGIAIGVTVTAALDTVPFPQELLGVTVMFPEVDPKVTVMEVVP
jgi:hypothetical protein